MKRRQWALFTVQREEGWFTNWFTRSGLTGLATEEQKDYEMFRETDRSKSL
jgi:hypothetical protein